MNMYPYPFDQWMAMETSALGRLLAVRDGNGTSNEALATRNGSGLPSAGRFEDDEPGYARTGSAGSVAVIRVEGPLLQRGGWFYDGYEAIQRRFATALGDPAVASVLLRINSPGGVCAGAFEAVRAMRQAKASAGKPVVAFADEMAFSAAYALATVADQIVMPEAGGVGSVGVIGVLYDVTALNEKMGLRVAVVTCGGQKADGHPDVPLTPEVIERYQARINQLGRQFAEVVGEAREMTPDAVLALQAACLYGRDAVRAGLADNVKTLSEAIRFAEGLGRKAQKSGPQGRKEGSMPDTIAIALGLAAGATESDQLARVRALVNFEAEMQRRTGAASAEEAVSAATRAINLERDVLQLAGKSTPAEALGVLHAHRAAAEQLTAAQSKNAELTAQIEQRDRDELMRQGRESGQITPALEQWATTQPIDGLRSFLAVAPAAVPGAASPARNQPPAEGTGGSPTTSHGKRWEEMSYDEKHNLYVENRQLYDKLKAEHERSGTTKTG